MTKYLLPVIDQKYELHKYRVFFNIRDALHAEELLTVLEQAHSRVLEVFCLSEDPALDVYIYPDLSSLSEVMGRSLRPSEKMRVIYADSTFLLAAPKMPNPLGEEIVRELGCMLYQFAVRERSIALDTLRSPSWLREGVCLQIPMRLRAQDDKPLLAPWAKLQEAQKAGKLIDPGAMIKDINLLPDQSQRQMAAFQSFFMVKLLRDLYCDKFVNRYGTLMSTFDDMDAEEGFRQVTSFDFEKFFHLFREWVASTNGFAVLSD